jgi:hypothetical protein
MRRKTRVRACRGAVTLGAVVLTVLLLSGCVILPVPIERSAGPNPASRTNIEDKPPTGIVVGETTRTQVLFMLGEPDGRGLQDAWFSYGSVAERGGLHWYVLMAAATGKGAAAGPMDSWDTSRRLTVRFDARGVVSDVSLDQKNCNASGGDCLQATGGDLAAADARAAALAAAGPLVATYQDFQLIGPIQQGCGSWPLFPNVEMDGPLTFGKEGLVWQSGYGYNRKWVNLAFADVDVVSSPVRHGFFTWVPVQKKDGSCFFFRIRDKGTSQEDFWSAMRLAVPTAATPQPAGTSR